MHHVRSHTKVPGNELADWLAECGVGETCVRSTRAHVWLQEWHRKERDPSNPRNREAHGPTEALDGAESDPDTPSAASGDG